MTITFQAASSAPIYCLASTSLAIAGAVPPAGLVGMAGPSDWTDASRNVVQVAEFFRAPTVGIFDRLNRRGECSFGVTRLFSSLNQAERFLFSHKESLPTSGLLTVLTTPDSGVSAAFYAVGAHLDRCLGSRTGVSVAHRYTFTLSGFVTTRPTTF